MKAEIVDTAEITDRIATHDRRDFVALLLAAFGGLFVLPNGGGTALAANAGAAPGERWEARGMILLNDRLRCRSGQAQLEIATHPDGTGSLAFWRDFADTDAFPNVRRGLFPAPTGRVTVQLPPGVVEALLGVLFAPRFRPVRLLPIAPHRHPEWAVLPTGDPELTADEIAAVVAQGIELSTDAGYQPGLFAAWAPYNALVWTYGRTFLAELEPTK